MLFSVTALITQILWIALIVFFVLLLVRIWNYTKEKLSNDHEIIQLLKDIQSRLDQPKQHDDMK